MNIEQGAGSAGHPIPGLGNATAKEFPAVLPSVTPMPGAIRLFVASSLPIHGGGGLFPVK